MIRDDGCWADYRTGSTVEGRPCLFLDRDGVLIEDTGYPHDPAAITLIPETLDLVRIANTSGFAVGVVTNQSGIGRGFFGWNAFAAVQGAIDTALAARGGRLDFVLACPHLADATLPGDRQEGHPWRKPAPGMLLAAAATLRLDLMGSIMVGDKQSDMAAATAAGLPRRILLDGTPPSGGNETWIAVGRRALSNWFLGQLAHDPVPIMPHGDRPAP